VTFPFDSDIELPEQIGRLDLDVGQLVCTGDAEIIYVSHAGAAEGSAIISHMGSTAYISTNHGRFRYGGWGPVIGDEGSGYWLGRAALRSIGEEYDQHRPYSQLWNEISAWLSSPNASVPEWQQGSVLWLRRSDEYSQKQYDPRTAVFGFAHELSSLGPAHCRALVAGLTAPLMRAWDAGDPAAHAIILQGADHLVRQYTKACTVADFDPRNKKLVLYGGVLVHNERFRELVLERLRLKYAYEFSPILPGQAHTMRPALGALLFALGSSNQSTLRLPDAKIIDNLVSGNGNMHSTGDLEND
jgi:N-acetylglucosamine kinase-like BadF-type ATPase